MKRVVVTLAEAQALRWAVGVCESAAKRHSPPSKEYSPVESQRETVHLKVLRGLNERVGAAHRVRT
jgi:hypothetical protein